MSGAPFWATLGIEPTRERREIRRAYALRLKATNPEDDPEGFQALRAAYERALAYAGPGGGEQIPRFEIEAEAKKAPRRRAEPREPPDQPENPEGEGSGPRTHDWRPAEEREKTLAGSRTRAWRAPEIVKPIRRVRERTHRPPDEAPPGPDDANERAYEAASQHLHRLIGDPARSSGELVQALKALLALPAMDSVERHARAETWLAGLITTAAPRCDGLIDPVVAYFHWDERRVGPRSTVGAMVLRRRDDLKFLASVKAPASRHHRAFTALSRPPTAWRRARYRLTPGLAKGVRGLLDTVRSERPQLMASLDAQALDWWEKRLARPHVGPISIWAIALWPALFALMAWSAEARDASTPVPWVVYVYMLAMVGAAVLFNLFAVEWPRQIWRARWAERAPVWARLGWAPGLCLALIAAALIPPSLAASLALGLAAALTALWALITGEPDRRPGVREGWQVRSIFAFFYLAVFWLLAAIDLPRAAYRQMSFPLVAAGLGFVMGQGSLIGAWLREASEPARRRWLMALAALVVLAAATMLIGLDQPWLRPLAAALVASAVLAHKAPAVTLSGARQRLRHYAMVYGWIGWSVVVTVAGPGREYALLIGGFWLLTGVAITGLGAFEAAAGTPKPPWLPQVRLSPRWLRLAGVIAFVLVAMALLVWAGMHRAGLG